MKRIRHLTWIAGILALTACSDDRAAAERNRQEAEAKVRAEAAKKEMETLPKTFQPRYNKKREQTDEKPSQTPKETPSPATATP